MVEGSTRCLSSTADRLIRQVGDELSDDTPQFLEHGRTLLGRPVGEQIVEMRAACVDEPRQRVASGVRQSPRARLAVAR